MIGTREERQAALAEKYPFWEELTLYQRLKQKAKELSNQVFLRTPKINLTYQQVLNGAELAAGGLYRIGVRPGMRVALLLGNSPEYVQLVFALSALGATKVAVNTELGETERQIVLENADPFFLMETGSLGITVRRYHEVQGFACVWTWQDLCAEGERRDWCCTEDPHQICDIIYTSGSNGVPKGVMISDDMLLRSAYASCLNRGFEFGRCIYVPLPLFHVYGYVEGLLTALLAEGSILIQQEKFLPESALRLMQDYRVNDMLIVPSMMLSLLKCPLLEQVNLTALHAVYCSASASPTWLWQSIRQKLQVHDVITGYGMTEVCGASMQTLPDDSDERLTNRVGHILPGGCAGLPEYCGHQVEYRVFDPVSGEPLSRGQAGELWCRGAVVSKGYFHNDSANAAAFTPDGWLRSGDVGCFDADGYLELIGRLSNMYKINGENVAPEFVERVLGECNLISHAEVVGVPDAKTGEAGAVFFELANETEQAAAVSEIRKYCERHLARFQIPKYYFVLRSEEWPMTGSGKISKRSLRTMAKSNLTGQKGGHDSGVASL